MEKRNLQLWASKEKRDYGDGEGKIVEGEEKERERGRLAPRTRRRAMCSFTLEVSLPSKMKESQRRRREETGGFSHLLRRESGRKRAEKV